MIITFKAGNVLPSFTFEELKIAAHTAFAHGAMRTNDAWLSPFRAQADLDNELVELKPSLFDPEFEPMITAKSPQGGKDILQSSSNTFYSNLTLAGASALLAAERPLVFYELLPKGEAEVIDAIRTRGDFVDVRLWPDRAIMN